jgi:hypothetical protein
MSLFVKAILKFRCQPAPLASRSCFAHGPASTLSYAIPAALKPRVSILGHPRNACVTPMAVARPVP